MCVVQKCKLVTVICLHQVDLLLLYCFWVQSSLVVVHVHPKEEEQEEVLLEYLSPSHSIVRRISI